MILQELSDKIRKEAMSAAAAASRQVGAAVHGVAWAICVMSCWPVVAAARVARFGAGCRQVHSYQPRASTCSASTHWLLQIELEREAKEAVSREKSLVERSLEAEQQLAEAMRKVRSVCCNVLLSAAWRWSSGWPRP